MDVRFDADGILAHNDEGAGIALHLLAWGGGAPSAAPAPTRRETACAGTGCTRRVEYVRPGLVEAWEERGRAGLEHSFAISTRLGGDGPLTLDMAVLGATAFADGGAVTLRPRTGGTLRYRDLAAWDATGRILPVMLAPTPAGIQLRVDDTGATYPLTIDPTLVTEAWRATLGQAGAGVGSSVAAAGDVNGDGYADVIVGARYYDGGQTDEGAAMLYLGSATGLSTTPDWQVESDQAGAELGFAVAGAGDVNGDGYDDIAVGIPKYDGARADAGRVDVYYGAASGPAALPSWTADAPSGYGWLGWSVGGAGDVNGDGYDDLLLGAPDLGVTGGVFLYLGSSSGLPAAYDWTVQGRGPSTGLGYYVAGVGDVDGDGFGDVAVGEPWYAGAAAGGGRALLYRGSARGVHRPASWSRVGNQADARLGNVVRSAGDLNADGYADLFVSIGDYDAAEVDGGGIEVYHGSPSGPGVSPAFSLLGTQANEWLEYGGAAGDTDGDGFDDLLIGATGHSDGESSEGAAWTYPGSSTGASSTPTRLMEPDAASAHFGGAIGGAGDVNGDGLADVIVGAYGWTGTAVAEGAAFVYLGSRGGGGDTGGTLDTGGTSDTGGTDLDGDGYPVGVDCDDTNGGIHPGATEIPYDGIDQDCSGGDLTDADGDGHDGAAVGGDDCDDADASVGAGDTWYPDRDADGWGDSAAAVTACARPADVVDRGGDCDDTDVAIHPTAAELTGDGRDENCDGVEECYADADEDGYRPGDATTRTADLACAAAGLADATNPSGDCDDADPAVFPGATETWYDGVDADCSGGSDADQDGDGHDASPSGGDDCDDTDAARFPGNPEVCDGVDNDCEGDVDEGSVCTTAQDTGVADTAGKLQAAEAGCGCGTSHPGSWAALLLGAAALRKRAPNVTGVGRRASSPAPGVVFTFLAACGSGRTTEFGSPMVRLDPGTFIMGAGAGDPDDAYADHEVTLTRGFWILEHEVTQGEWFEWAGTTEGVVYSGGERTPVDNAGWTDAALYANALSTAEGRDACYDADGANVASAFSADPYACLGYRLPTEAEWEYAARAGEDTIYAGSDSVGAVAWTEENSDGIAQDVGGLQPNAWGLFDMSGNVMEWTNDWYTYDADAAPARDPAGPPEGRWRGHRGGGCKDPESRARVTTSDAFVPGYGDCAGFRLVRTDPSG